ncbi:MAG: hypothetical protein KC912_06155 [Proteobacteria bacterium]|nr:hypothetical protein [Pseudomonadota bacterium]
MPLSPELFSALDAPTQRAIAALSKEPLVPFAALIAEVFDYRQHLLHVAMGQPQINIDLAEALVAASLQLLQSQRHAEADVQRLVQTAVRYFVLEDDGEGDLTSLTGLEDDRKVFNIAVAALGLTHLHVESA